MALEKVICCELLFYRPFPDLLYPHTVHMSWSEVARTDSRAQFQTKPVFYLCT